MQGLQSKVMQRAAMNIIKPIQRLDPLPCRCRTSSRRVVHCCATAEVQQPTPAAEPANSQQKKGKQPQQPKRQNKQQQQAHNTSSAEEIRALRIEKVRPSPAESTTLVRLWCMLCTLDAAD
eukprot:GHRQ01031652.1.p1 GENE.GHRQ01031652.1~~GHRQ01031652.1.p1  ORF type:complete len:121 (+),score=40.97 GHRQ01031652.1:351-713(+)